MNIVIVGGTGLIGARLVKELEDRGHHVTPAALETGVDLLTGHGLAAALRGADVVVAVSNAPSFVDSEVMDFFTTATGNLLRAAQHAGVTHYVALSIVGCDQLPDNGYLRAKHAQEQLIAAYGLPYTIVRATQFFEFASGIADAATRDGTVRVPTGHFQPMAADDVVAALARCAVAEPAGGVREIAGPERVRMSSFIERVLAGESDPREVVASDHATYFGAEIGEDSLVPGPEAFIASTTYADWVGAPGRRAS